MELRTYPSRYLEKAVQQFAKLPGIGQKTAFRLVLHMLKDNNGDIQNFVTAICEMKEHIRICKRCHNLSDSDICNICSNSSRNPSLVCVVESFKEVMAIENTMRFNGLYHVLGGLISPMDGIGPSELNISSLETRIKEEEVKEVILALSTTMEGETTGLFLYKKLAPSGVTVTTLARGVSVGDHLEYTDELTLGQSIMNRVMYKGQ